MNLIRKKDFKNGTIFLFKTRDGLPIETTDTFLPYYTKNAVASGINKLNSCDMGSRLDRWMIGVSVASGCPVNCKFCATGALKKYRNLTADEIVEQVNYVREYRKFNNFLSAKEHKVNYTRMGEPFLNIDNVKSAIKKIEHECPNTHHYISTIGIKGSDFSWIRGNITLQISLHSVVEKNRDELIPFPRKMSLGDLGSIRTKSALKTTLNFTLVNREDFDISILRKYFDPKYFFVKLSPINKNIVSEANNCGDGVVKIKNIA